MDKHINLLGVLWIALGGLGFLAGFFVFSILFGISYIPDMGHDAPIILRTVGLGVGMFLWILSIPKVIAGVGLLKKQEWGRILALVVSFLSLLDFPLGTALAVYTFVVLIKEDTIKVFRHGTEKKESPISPPEKPSSPAPPKKKAAPARAKRPSKDKTK